MKIAVSEEGIELLRKLSADVQDGVDDIRQETGNLRQIADDYPDDLIRADLLGAALDDISSALDTCVEPAEGVSESLLDIAEGYEDILGTDYFNSSGN